MSILKYFAKKQVGSLPYPEATLSNARVHTKFHCFGNWHLLEVITRKDLIVAKDTIRENYLLPPATDVTDLYSLLKLYMDNTCNEGIQSVFLNS